MRKPFLLAAAIAALSGCKTAPPSDQPSAERFLDEQIATSAAAISQSQFRLQQTSPALPPTTTPVATIASTSVPVATAVAHPVRAPLIQQAPVAKPVSTSASVTTSATVSSAQPTASSVTSPGVASTIAPVKTPPSAAPLTTAKVIPAASIPPVVQAKITTPPKPLPEPWAISANDATLRRALNKWVQRAGWQLVWDASVDVPINVDAKFTGDFNTAVKHLFQSLSAADVNLSAVLYSGNRVLRVTESGRRAQ